MNDIKQVVKLLYNPNPTYRRVLHVMRCHFSHFQNAHFINALNCFMLRCLFYAELMCDTDIPLMMKPDVIIWTSLPVFK